MPPSALLFSTGNLSVKTSLLWIVQMHESPGIFCMNHSKKRLDAFDIPGPVKTQLMGPLVAPRVIKAWTVQDNKTDPALGPGPVKF